jgi:hypothetical protein
MMAIPKNISSRNQREEYWHTIFNEWLASGKQICNYCEEKKIAVSSFYQWRNRLLPTYLKRRKTKKRSDQRLFVPIALSTKENFKRGPAGDLTLHYPSGCYLQINGSFESEVLKKLN